VVSELEREHKVYAGRMTLWEYDYLKPTTKLAVNQGEEAEEVYDYPGGYREHDEGDHKARLLLEAQEAERDIVRGGSTATGLEPGFSFKLEGHFHRDMNGKYFLTQVQHMAQAGAYRAWENEAGLDYHNTFLCIPDGTPFRPHRRTPRPVIQGSQSALVVGPAGAEVHTDSHGRIKVHFYWDRDSQKDEKSSCWIRVSTPWGGKGWGAVSIPRIGNEVLVAFEEGDPDRPIIIGSVYNADQTPPFALPGADIQMGMKSRSSPGGGGMNEITMTDTKGKELMNVHAQYDMVTKVLHDDTQTIVNDRTIGVTGKHTETITKDTSVTISEGNYTFKVSTGTGSFDIKGKVTETYHATQDTTVKGNITIKSTTGAILVQAANEIKLHTGDSAITLKKDGTITIQGKKIQVIGADEIKESAPKVAISATDEAKFGVSSQLITCDKAKVNTAGAAINASAVGMHEITGAVVKIN
jgi:type VI secretion system secreted protein VgrG